MRTNLQKIFEVEEYRWVPFWWDPSIQLRIRYIGNEDYRAWADEKSSDAKPNKATEQYGEIIQKGHMVAGGAVASMRPGQTKRKEYNRVLEAYLAKGMSEAGISMNEVATEQISALSDPEGVARFLLYDIDGMADEEGNAIAYTPEFAIEELFSETNPIPDDLIIEESSGNPEDELYIPAGTPFGVAFRRGIVWEASRHHKFNKAQEDAVKN
jgi:hypothetical protein